MLDYSVRLLTYFLCEDSECLTDNSNRCVSRVKEQLNKYGWVFTFSRPNFLAFLPHSLA